MQYKTVNRIFDTIEIILIFGAGFCLMKVMFGFTRFMNAWSELDKLL
tara:strand:+ start:518 stop:658 length:141 start_codon:yes stop_codon:yes gene_type:complete